MAWNNSAKGETKEFNVVKNFGLRCYEQKVSDKAVILKCSMNRKDKETGEYSAPIYIDVVCSFEKCDIAQDDYAKAFISVNGTFAVGDYTNKAGEKVPTMTIFASSVVKN